jgi:hypothetical protein
MCASLNFTATRFVLIIWLASAAGIAWGWGDEGHEIVGVIASHYLKPKVKQKVVAILAADNDSLTAHTIAAETTWADKFRDSDRNTTKVHYNQTHEWHFVDIELSAPDLDAACFGHPVLPPGVPGSEGPPDDCVADKIDHFIAELRAPGTSSEERLQALKFLLHFVGDIHQPLHASDDHDSGGNQKKVSAAGLAAGNLHHFWDTTFIEELGTDPFSVGNALHSKITKAQVKSWSKGTPAAWARESFQVAKVHAYGKLPAPTRDGSYHLSTAYVKDATKVVKTQLSKAGVRLALTLNNAFAE